MTKSPMPSDEEIMASVDRGMENINSQTGEITYPIRNANPTSRKRVQTQVIGLSRAKQSFADECNINNIMKKYEKNGLIEHVNTHQGQYGNFIGFQDYQTSSNQILEAEAAFMSIPANIRREFDHDPAKFLEFAQNPENLDKFIEMGLAPPRPREASTDPSPSTEPKDTNGTEEGGEASPEAGPPPTP